MPRSTLEQVSSAQTRPALGDFRLRARTFEPHTASDRHTNILWWDVLMGPMAKEKSSRGRGNRRDHLILTDRAEERLPEGPGSWPDRRALQDDGRISRHVTSPGPSLD